MTSIQAPPWAMIAAALDGAGDSHLPEGMHVRALPSARLGLPATPLELTRAVVPRQELLQVSRLNGMVWIDSKGANLSVPFEVTPDNPVLGYFPAGAAAVWAQLEVRPGRESAATVAPSFPSELVPQPSPRPDAVPGPLGTAVPAPPPGAVPAPLPTGVPAPLPTARPPLGGAALPRPVPIPRPPPPAAFDPALRFEAVADSVNGPTVIQGDAGAPFVLAHWTIPRVRVSGRGWVTGIRWVDAARIQRREYAFWQLWSLPVRPAPRYNPTPGAELEARERVQQAAVQRQPMHVAWSAATPASAPPALAVDADQRLGQVKPDLDRWLERLLFDLAQPTWELQDSHKLAKQHADSQDGALGLGIEKFLLIASIDPDVGHYLGLGSLDRGMDAEPGSLVLYRIRGLFRFNPAAWSADEMAALAPAWRAGREAAVAAFPELKQYGIVPAEDGQFLDLFQYAIAALGQPARGMHAPQLLAPDERGWLPTPPPPEVRRAVRLIAMDLHAPALAAVAAQDQYGERSLHAFPGGQRMAFGSSAVPPGTPLSWVVSQPQDPKEAGQGRFEDRAAPASPVTYRIARGDWFGRWSGWGKRIAAPPPRTVPSRPAILINVTAPVFDPPPKAPPAGLLSSAIELRIPLPETDELPAGGAQLKELELVETFGANPAVTVPFRLDALPAQAAIVPDPSSAPSHPQHILKIARVGPALAAAGQSKVVYTARWRDVLDHVSADAFPAVKTVIDPRPPAAPVIVRPLAYTARPDSLGHARVEFAFPGADGVGYRVYASTETTLLKALEAIDQPLAQDIANTALINERAAALVDHKSLFGWDHFELITPEPLYRDPTTHQVRFVHRVSGGLNVAVFYRVVAEGPHGGLSELSAASMFAFGVPNVGGPGQPQVAVVSVPGANPVEDGVRLHVKVPYGASRPAAWRLRRTSTPLAAPLLMPIVLQGALAAAGPAPEPDAPADPEGYHFDIDAPAPLKAWVSYRFVVEVQGEAPPGATDVAGEWGDASAPVKLAVMPAAPPKAPQQVHVSVEAGGMRIVLTPQALENWGATMMGSFTFETWRSAAGARPFRVQLLYAHDASSGTWQAFDPAPVPAGNVTSVAVRILDPLGRASAATSSSII
jgi:hypothetical protein